MECCNLASHPLTGPLEKLAMHALECKGHSGLENPEGGKFGDSAGELGGGRGKAEPWAVTERPHPGDGGRLRMCKCFLAPDPDVDTSGRRAGLGASCDPSKTNPWSWVLCGQKSWKIRAESRELSDGSWSHGSSAEGCPRAHEGPSPQRGRSASQLRQQEAIL